MDPRGGTWSKVTGHRSVADLGVLEDEEEYSDGEGSDEDSTFGPGEGGYNNDKVDEEGNAENIDPTLGDDEEPDLLGDKLRLQVCSGQDSDQLWLPGGCQRAKKK